MVANLKQLRFEKIPQPNQPIKFITENGFSILRLCEIDERVAENPRDCGFIVEGENKLRREIRVTFDPKLVAQVNGRRRVPLNDRSIVWIICAENCLANYVWEHDEYPKNGRLLVSELSPDQLMLALHWRDSE